MEKKCFLSSPLPFQQGFTLLELSIVLVIIGLIVGGVMVGQELIKQGQIRTLITDIDKYRVMVLTFRTKYNALPGDMANATQYWGVQDPTPATCKTSASTDSKTCDGNGDGKIQSLAPTNFNERHRAWQHLANAGLLTGTYT
jgi:prepilin-type N-terminal cleavage/methylation domain-containing protein